MVRYIALAWPENDQKCVHKATEILSLIKKTLLSKETWGVDFNRGGLTIVSRKDSYGNLYHLVDPDDSTAQSGMIMGTLFRANNSIQVSVKKEPLSRVETKKYYQVTEKK